MASATDAADRNLEQFAYHTSKDGKVFITWDDKTVTTLKGERARRFLARIESLGEREAQLVMAKATGNFKRGNERLAKQANGPGPS
jgi:hypothetical protein